MPGQNLGWPFSVSKGQILLDLQASFFYCGVSGFLFLFFAGAGVQFFEVSVHWSSTHSGFSEVFCSGLLKAPEFSCSAYIHLSIYLSIYIYMLWSQ